MKIVALISGGKDSLYNLLLCKKYHHEITCLANLIPYDNIHEIDSFTYQSVGYNMIPLISKAMKVPLVRQCTYGKSINSNLQYEYSREDEVEDLYLLLKKVITLYPDVKGVSSGAILSTYQRTRIEHVLGLTSFCYLWQSDQSQLLEDMLESNMEILLIKTATDGLIPRNILGKTIRQIMPILQAGKKFGMNVAGEGGEYESLVLDCELYNSKIVIDSSEMCGDMLDNRYAPNGYLNIKSAHLEDKITGGADYCMDLNELNSEQSIIANNSNGTAIQFDTNVINGGGSWLSINSTSSEIKTYTMNFCPDYILSQNLIYINTNNLESKEDDEEQVHWMINYLKYQLSLLELTLKDITFVNVTIPTMNHYSLFNSIYSKYFHIHPPARVTYANNTWSLETISLAKKLNIKFGFKDIAPSFYENLHVQSISKWAPANIGPYSQANVFNNIIWMAGQIGLISDTMVLAEKQLQTCIVNCKSVLSVLNSDILHVFDSKIYISAESYNKDGVIDVFKSSKKNNVSPLVLTVEELPRYATHEVVLMAWQLKADRIIEVETYQNRASSSLGQHLIDATYSSIFNSAILCYKSDSGLLNAEHLIDWCSVLLPELVRIAQFSKLSSKDLILNLYCEQSYYDLVFEKFEPLMEDIRYTLIPVITMYYNTQPQSLIMKSIHVSTPDW